MDVDTVTQHQTALCHSLQIQIVPNTFGSQKLIESTPCPVVQEQSLTLLLAPVTMPMLWIVNANPISFLINNHCN